MLIGTVVVLGLGGMYIGFKKKSSTIAWAAWVVAVTTIVLI